MAHPTPADEPCPVCAAKNRDGWNSTDWFHCSACCAIWTGRNRGHCTVCHETFNSISAADFHWLTDFGHMHPANLEDLFEKKFGLWYLLQEGSGKCAEGAPIQKSSLYEGISFL